METDINSKYNLALAELKKAYAEIEELKKENEQLRVALLSGSNVIIKQDQSTELIAAQELIKSLMEQVYRMNCLSRETLKTEYEHEIRMRQREYNLRMEKGLK